MERDTFFTIAAGGSEEYLANTELEKIAETVNWLGLMSYDFAGPWSKTSGHNAPLFADPANSSPDAPRNTVAAAVMRYLNTGVPPEKLLLGLSLYGRTWRGCDPRNDGGMASVTGLVDRWRRHHEVSMLTAVMLSDDARSVVSVRTGPMSGLS